MIYDYTLNLARHGRLDPVEYHVSDEYRVVYVENAKVACTAIKQLLYPDIDYEAVGQDRFHEETRDRAVFTVPGRARDYLHFSVFRNPQDRLISAFKDKMLSSAATRGHSILHTRFHRALFTLFAGIDTARPGIDFPAFTRAVGAVPDRLRDRHIATQAPRYAAVVAARRHLICKLETLEDDWAILCQATGISPLPQLNRSSRSDRQPVGIDPATHDLIGRIYAQDYARIGY